MMSELASLGTAQPELGSSRVGSRLAVLVAAVAMLVLLLPWAILVSELRDWRALLTVWDIYPDAWLDGLRYAAGSAVVAVLLAMGADALFGAGVAAGGRAGPRGLRWLRASGFGLLVLTVLGAVTPAALIGDAFAVAYVRYPWLYDHWPIMSLVTAARFAIVPMLALRVAGLPARNLAGMAAVDGASRAAAYFRIRLPLGLPALGAGGLIAGLLALTEVAATHLVAPAGVSSVALTLFNDIHYGRNDAIVGMSLYLMALVAVIVLAAGGVASLRRRFA
jgi:ABC-type Fe3+ transport system permease subunit